MSMMMNIIIIIAMMMLMMMVMIMMMIVITSQSTSGSPPCALARCPVQIYMETVLVEEKKLEKISFYKLGPWGGKLSTTYGK